MVRDQTFLSGLLCSPFGPGHFTNRFVILITTRSCGGPCLSFIAGLGTFIVVRARTFFIGTE
jgi:hypothetical protein